MTQNGRVIIWPDSVLAAILTFPDKAKAFIESWNEKRYTVKDAEDISYRAINYWTEAGLFDDERTNKQGWRKLSNVDVLWLKIIYQLRIFGFSNQAIALTKQSLFTLKHVGPAPILEYFSAIALGKKEGVSILVYQDGTAQMALDSLVNLSKAVWTLSEMSYLTINFNALLQSALKGKEQPEPLNFDTRLDKGETELVGQIDEGKYDSIEIKLENGKIKRLLLHEWMPADKRIIDMVRENKFQDISLHVMDGKMKAERKSSIKID